MKSVIARGWSFEKLLMLTVGATSYFAKNLRVNGVTLLVSLLGAHSQGIKSQACMAVLVIALDSAPIER